MSARALAECPVGQVVGPGDELMLLGQPVRFVSIPAEWAGGGENPMGAWFRHYGVGRPELPPPDAVQLVWGDDDDHFPGDPRCDPIVAAAQPHGAAPASPAWCADVDPRLSKQLIAAARVRRFA